MKKKLMLIGIPIIIVLVIVIIIFNITNNISKHIEYSIDTIKDGLLFLQEHKYKDSGTLKVTAKYKGAHGEHYPKDFNYYFETNLENGKYKVTIGNTEGYVTKEYTNELNEIVENLKQIEISKIDYLNYEKEGNTYVLDIDVVNDIFDTNYNKCTIDIETEGIFNKYVSSTIKCDDELTIKLSDNKTTINYHENIIKIDSNETGFSININDELKMNTFYEDDSNRHSIVIGNDVYLVLASENKLYLSSSSQAAIYNAIEIDVTYDDIVLNKMVPLDEIDIPIFRYFNEFEYNYWRDTNE